MYESTEEEREVLKRIIKLEQEIKIKKEMGGKIDIATENILYKISLKYSCMKWEEVSELLKNLGF